MQGLKEFAVTNARAQAAAVKRPMEISVSTHWYGAEIHAAKFNPPGGAEDYGQYWWLNIGELSIDVQDSRRVEFVRRIAEALGVSAITCSTAPAYSPASTSSRVVDSLRINSSRADEHRRPRG